MKQIRLLTLLALLMTAATGAWAQEPTTYSAKMKAGTQDAKNWTIASGEKSAKGDAADGLTGLSEKDAVTLTYTGRLKVKGVKATSDAAPAANSVDLSTLTADYEAQDGDVLTGTLGANVKISIADGATVTLKNLSINASGTWTSGNHAGITCPGNATISLEGTNTVKGFYEDYPGIHIAKGKTLYIKGSGTLTAIGGGYGAGIGGGYDISCGNIEIQDGTVNAQGGRQSAGIGSGVYYNFSSDCGTITISGGTVNATGGVSASGIGSGDKGTCSDITISGGTVNATGGENNSGVGTGAGIGSGKNGTCGNITIANTVTKVTATSSDAPHSIGKGTGGSCGTVTIGGTKYWENNAAVNGGDTYLATSPLIYDPTAPAKTPATVTKAPTATAAIIEVNSTSALVNAGATNGGSMMYAVTATNAQPASTDGFSASVPTAEGRTAGTYYVWYYAKADAEHSDSEIAGPVSVTLAVMTTVTWNSSNIGGSYPNCLSVMGTSQSYTKEGITLSANANMNNAEWYDYGDESMNGISFQANESGGYTFTAPTGKQFTEIEMTLTNSGGWDMASLGTGWAFGVDYVNEIYKVTWTGSAASTVGLLTGVDNFDGVTVKSIVFTLADAE